MDEATKLPIGPEEVAEAAQILQRYKAGKAALDKRLVDNELWFRMGHWKNYQNPMMEGKPQPSSGWLFNSIANKHADAMDNYPSPNVLPRAEDDEAAAQALSSVLPVVLEQADYEQVYSDTWWRKLKQGTGVKGVFWDPEQRGGVGEIAIRPMNLLMLYWEPGVDDIQASPHFFSLSLADTAQLESRWPQLAGHTASVLDVPHYIHDGGLDTSDKSVVVDWYYKKLSPEGRSVLHYCKFCNGVVLYASENDPELAERGFYDHGRYPFVFDALFMEEDSPAGFGYIDVMKECQTAIDKMNHAMDENVLLSSRQRYVLSDTAGVNEEELTDLSRDIIHVVGRLNDDSFRPLQTAGLQGNSLSYRNSRIEELKEISGNRDMTQGGTAGPTCRLEASGHAGYAPAGQDIVCAGASTLMQTLCALLAGEKGTKSGVWDEPDGPRLAVTAAAPQKPWVEGAFEFAKAGFALLAERYPDNVRFADLSGRGEQSMVDLQLFASEGGDAAAPSAPALSHAQAQQAIASGTMKADEGREASDVPTPAAVQEPEERPAPPERPAPLPLPPIPGLREGANTVRALHARWAAEEAMLRRDMPDFSLKQELANPEMRRLMELPGMRMGDAYRLAHYNDALRQTAQTVEQGVVERIRQRSARPAENGTSPGGAAITRADVASMTRAQREALERRAMHGVKISF